MKITNLTKIYFMYSVIRISSHRRRPQIEAARLEALDKINAALE